MCSRKLGIRFQLHMMNFWVFFFRGVFRTLESWNRQVNASVESCADEVVELDLEIIVAGEQVEGSRYVWVDYNCELSSLSVFSCSQSDALTEVFFENFGITLRLQAGLHLQDQSFGHLPLMTSYNWGWGRLTMAWLWRENLTSFRFVCTLWLLITLPSIKYIHLLDIQRISLQSVNTA